MTSYSPLPSSICVTVRYRKHVLWRDFASAEAALSSEMSLISGMLSVKEVISSDILIVVRSGSAYSRLIDR